jgi:predicted O-methyltransferase YrrM
MQLIKQSELNVTPLERPATQWFWMSSWNELEVLVALVRSVAPLRVLEIGVNFGQTARLLLDNVPSIQSYVGVDVLPGYATIKEKQRNEVPKAPGTLVKNDPRFHLMLSERGSFDLTPGIGEFDVVFVDGDHGRAAVEYDTALATQIVRPDGIIIWHDYFIHEEVPTLDVRPVLDELSATRPIFHVEDTWLAFERR